mmetsp:Transcript_24717/g.67496  ORF Transcript_24717/g.67496 Transcript_24717/m.67496 type:complete len:263 (+) Transcript_24717:1465-2253(+)
MRVDGSPLPCGAQVHELLLALRIQSARLDLLFDECAPGLAERSLGGVLHGVHVLLDPCLRLVYRLDDCVEDIHRIIHGFEGIVLLSRLAGNKRLCTGIGLVGLVSAIVHQLLYLCGDGVRGLLVGRLLSSSSLVLHALLHLLVRLRDFLLELGVGVLHLANPWSHLHQLALGIGQWTRPHAFQLLSLLVDVLGALLGAVCQVLQHVLDLLHKRLVGRVRLEVDGPLVSSQGKVALLVILFRPALHAHEATAVILGWLGDGLQ